MTCEPMQRELEEELAQVEAGGSDDGPGGIGAGGGPGGDYPAPGSPSFEALCPEAQLKIKDLLVARLGDEAFAPRHHEEHG